jgi:hypothetical protein
MASPGISSCSLGLPSGGGVDLPAAVVVQLQPHQASQVDPRDAQAQPQLIAFDPAIAATPMPAFDDPGDRPLGQRPTWVDGGELGRLGLSAGSDQQLVVLADVQAAPGLVGRAFVAQRAAVAAPAEAGVAFAEIVTV